MVCLLLAPVLGALMARQKIRRRPPKFEQTEEGFVIGRDTTRVKKPTQKELDAMRQRGFIRKHPPGSTI